MGRPISVIIPNYNGVALMEQCLPSVRKALADYGPGGELIVVDDGSDDGSPQWLGEHAPEAKVAVHGQNRGFSAACTTGIREALHETVVLLNTDVEPLAGFFEPMVETLARPGVFAVGAVALDEGGRSIGENLKIPRLSLGRLKFEKHRDLSLEEFRRRVPEPMPTLFVTGGFMALKRPLFFELGGFDPLFEPFYYEDADLCIQAWLRGFEVLLDPRSAAIHRHRGTILTFEKARYVRTIQERNRLLLLWKNLTPRTFFCTRHLLPLAARSLVKWAVLDLRFYTALFKALSRVRLALAARRANAQTPLSFRQVHERLKTRKF